MTKVPSSGMHFWPAPLRVLLERKNDEDGKREAQVES